jgi:Holliday junction resolvase RusA-like endonuclease
VIRLRVDGPPTGKGRPRFGNGRTYTPKPTVLAEARIERAWEDAGKPRLPDGPVALELWLVVARPQGHFKRDGSLSAAGLRESWPRKKPDLDNSLKLVMDALSKKAYRDDVDVVHAWAVRRWANPGEVELTTIYVRPMASALEAAA